MSKPFSSQKYAAFGACVAGSRHNHDHIPCEDAWGREILPDSLIIAVADGLSSAEHGGKGASLAVASSIKAAVDELRKRGQTDADPEVKTDIPDIIRQAVRAGRDALESCAASEEMPLSSYATTLLIALMSHDGVYCGHIGDGACVIISGEVVSLLSAPGNAEYANETPVLTGKDWEKQLRISIGSGDAVLLATDGCQGALIQKEEGLQIPYGPFIVPLLTSLKRFFLEGRECNSEIADLLSSSRMRALSSDDMTLAAGIRISGESV